MFVCSVLPSLGFYRRLLGMTGTAETASCLAEAYCCCSTADGLKDKFGCRSDSQQHIRDINRYMHHI